MLILRSIFWLAIAFCLIGPQTNWGKTATDVAQGGLELGATAAETALERFECDTMACEGQKLMAGHAITVAQNDLTARIETLQPNVSTQSPLLAPIPQPRLDRAIVN